MRIRRLNLLKYGHFEDAAIALPVGEADLHIIYGDNEAGKSTTLAALEDLLFGFPKSTPYNFRFANSKLRIGASLANGKTSFDFLRRKGNKDTIVDEDGKAIADGEKKLAALLQGVDQAMFRRLFFLNHERLRRGADDLLTVGEDAGETLLAAGAGIEGLAEILADHDSKADSLWARTGGQKRKFTQANKRLAEAKKAERDASINVAAYKRAKKSAKEAADNYERVRGEVETQQTQLAKLARIRRVYRNIQSLINVENSIDALGDVVELPEVALEQLNRAESELQKLNGARELHETRIKKRQELIASLAIDEALLQRRADVEALGSSRVIAEKDRNALPRRREDLEALMETVAGQLADLGWALRKDQTPGDLLPAAPVVTKARKHAATHGSVWTTLETAKTALRDAEARLSRLREGAPADESNIDLKALRAACASATDGRRGIGARQQAEQQRRKAEAQAARLLAGLSPTVNSIETLRQMSVPSPTVIEHHRDRVLSLVNERDSTSDALDRLRGELADARQRADARRAKSPVATDADLEALRGKRDTAWTVLARKYLDQEPVAKEEWTALFGDDQTGKSVYEDLVSDADRASDERFDKAEHVAHLNELEGRIASYEQREEALSAELSRLEGRLEDFATDWSGLWAETGLTPGTPDQMLMWSQSREACLERQQEIDELTVEIEQHLQHEDGLIKAILAEIEALGLESPLGQGASLDAAIEYANEVVQETEAAHNKAEARAEDIAEADASAKEMKTSLDSAREALDDWQTRWEGILSELGLDKATIADDVNDYLVLIESVRSNIAEADNIRRERIEKIERDIAQYESKARATAEAIAKDLAGNTADDIALALQERLTSSQANQKRRQEAQDEINEAAEHLDELRESELEFTALIEDLQRQAGTESLETLRKLIKRSDDYRDLVRRKSDLEETLVADGDGYSIAELKEEVEGVDLDKAAAETQLLESEVKAKTEAMGPLRDEMQRTKTDLDAIGTSGDAAIAASRIETAYADMDAIAASFVRARTAEKLLRWGIEYFRKQKQGPMLAKATALFSTITGDRYSKLIVEYDKDTPIIAGVDQNGSTKPASAMSDGTRDQLFLALKLAAIQDYIERAEPMPFVADDLFINFDDTRTAQALNALFELSKQCQVVLFTHHAHLVEIARSTLGSDLSVVSLE